MGRQGGDVTAHAYILWADIPHTPISTCRQCVDDVTGAKLVAFDGYEFTGQLDQVGDRLQVEFSFPRSGDQRDELIGWFMHWDIPFTVVP